jgi:sugar/nucleoside kinase (ribokinase family)
VLALIAGREPGEALRWACAAGAIAAARPGAQPSLPAASEVDAILGRRSPPRSVRSSADTDRASR